MKRGKDGAISPTFLQDSQGTGISDILLIMAAVLEPRVLTLSLAPLNWITENSNQLLLLL